MKILLTVLGLFAGIAIGVLVFQISVLATAFVTNCFKNCGATLWPHVLIVCLPLGLCLWKDLKERVHLDGVGSGWRWLYRRSIPLGMGLSNLQLNHAVVSLILRLGDSLWT